MIKTFDSQNLKELRKDIDAALASVKAKHGVSLSLGNISYDPTIGRATTKMTMFVVGDGAAATDPRAVAEAKRIAEFKVAAESYGLKVEQLGATFTYGRDTYKLAGLNTKARKRPVLGTSLRDGKTYVFPEEVIRSLQSKEYLDLYGYSVPVSQKATGTVSCSNTNAFDAQFKPIGKCNRPATTSRKGFGRNSKSDPYCDECARLIDESRAEMAAEARCS